MSIALAFEAAAAPIEIPVRGPATGCQEGWEEPPPGESGIDVYVPSLPEGWKLPLCSASSSDFYTAFKTANGIGSSALEDCLKEQDWWCDLLKAAKADWSKKKLSSTCCPAVVSLPGLPNVKACQPEVPSDSEGACAALSDWLKEMAALNGYGPPMDSAAGCGPMLGERVQGPSLPEDGPIPNLPIDVGVELVVMWLKQAKGAWTEQEFADFVLGQGEDDLGDCVTGLFFGATGAGGDWTEFGSLAYEIILQIINEAAPELADYFAAMVQVGSDNWEKVCNKLNQCKAAGDVKLPCGGPETANPVDLGHGAKIMRYETGALPFGGAGVHVVSGRPSAVGGSTTDPLESAMVASTARAYTSSPSKLTSAIVGHNHGSTAFTYVIKETGSSLKLRGMFGTRVFQTSDDIHFFPAPGGSSEGPDQDFFIVGFGKVTPGVQQQQKWYAVFRHIQPDGSEEWYLRDHAGGYVGDIGEDVEPTPETWEGLKIAERDGHGGAVDYVYGDFGPPNASTPRLMRQIYSTMPDWTSEPYEYMERKFTWNVLHAPKGTLYMEEVKRFAENGDSRVVQTIKYLYGNATYQGHASFGDLRQVRVEDFLDHGSSLVKITQFRYYTDEDYDEAADDQDDDGDGYIERGGPHQLKLVIEPSAFEYLVEHAADEGYETVDQAAQSLYYTPDGAEIELLDSTTRKVVDLASKFVTRYEISGKQRVLEQFVLQPCGCTGSTSGRRITYDYWSYPSPSGDQVSETVRLKEWEWLGDQDGSLIGVTFYDLTRFGESDGPASTVNMAVYDDDPESNENAKKWVTHYAYYPTTQLLRLECTPSACFNYIPGVPADGSEPASPPVYQASSSTGLVHAYVYNSLKSLTHVMVGDGDKTVTGGTPAFNHDGFTLVEQRSYEAPDASSVPERRTLPTEIRRFKNPVTGTAPTGVDDADIEVTEIEYGFWNENSGMLAWMSVFEEAETVTENGPAGSSNKYKTTTIFDEAGRAVFTRDPNGLVKGTTYHFRTGAVTKETLSPTGFSTYLAEHEHPFDPPGGESWSGSGGPPSLETTYAYNLFGNLRCLTAPDGTRTYHLYGAAPATLGSPLNRPFITTVTFAGEGTSLEFAGPATRAWLDVEKRPIRNSQFEIENGGSFDGDARTLTGLELGDEVWRSEVDRDLGGVATARRDYLDLPTTEAHAEWKYKHDARGRLEYQIDPDSSFTRYTYDRFDRVTEVRTGVESSGSYGTDYLVSKFVYDGADATSGEPTPGVGNGHLTHTLAYTGPTDADFRLTRFHFDFRGRTVAVENALPPHSFFVYDNQDRVTASATFASLPSSFAPSSILTPTDRGAYAEQSYSQRGLRYRSRAKIDPTTAISTSDPSGDFLQSDWWFDGAGRIRATRTPDAPGTKIDLDLYGRPRKLFLTDNNGDPLPGASGNYDAALSVSDDHVLEQTVNRYASNGRLEFVTNLKRTHWAEPSGSSYQGDLDNSSYNWVIRTYTGLWHDALGRVTRTVDFGTNDSQSRFIAGTSAPTWPPTTQPEWSDSAYEDAHVSATEFNDRGWISARIDPMGKRTEFRYDAAGRRIAVIENADTGTPVALAWSTNSGGRWDVTHGLDPDAPDANRVTTYAYDSSGRVIREVAHLMVLDSSAMSTTYIPAVQVTAHDYGVTASSGGSLVTSNRLLAATRYPNSATGEAGTTSAFTVSFTYNRLGEAIGRTDQNGTVHQLTRDDLGRVTRDDVTAFGSGIDASVTAIATTFDAFGRAATVQSFTGSGGSTLRDEVAYAYTPLGLIESVAQNHDGPTSGTGSSATRTVSYAYREDGMGHGNSSRPTTLTYPDGTTYHYQYGTSGSIDDRVSRLAKASVGSTSSDVAFEWKYLGLAAPVVMTLAEPVVDLDRVRARHGITTTGLYHALDQFGRVTQHRWVDGEFANDSSHSSYSTIPPIVDLGYSYDAASNITGRYDARLGASRTDRHEEFEIDGLDRVLEARRGVRTGSSSFSFAPSSQQWRLDALGNWESVKTNANTSGTYAATETREHNLANEIEELDPDGTGSTNPYTLTHDDAGNLLTRQISHFGGGTTLSFVHDAWNRLVEVQSNSVSRTKLRYNGLNWLTRRIADFRNSSNQILSDGTLDQVRVYSYGPEWRMLEQRIYDGYNAGTGAYGDESRRALLFQGVGGIDDHLLRQEEQIPSGGGSSTFKKHYLLRDGGRSIIAIVNESGVLEQRVRFDAYGNARHRWRADVDGDGDVDATDRGLVTSSLNKYLHQSGYNVDADLNRDGVVDSTDLGQVTTSDYRSALRTGLISEPYTSAATGAVDNDIGYSGYVFMVEVGLYHVRHRTYEPILARWLERDPIGYVDGMSLYLYVRGRPIDLLDPDGLWGVGFTGHLTSWFADTAIQVGATAASAAASAVGSWAGQSAAGAGAVFTSIGGASAHDLQGQVQRNNINYTLATLMYPPANGDAADRWLKQESSAQADLNKTFAAIEKDNELRAAALLTGVDLATLGALKGATLLKEACKRAVGAGGPQEGATLYRLFGGDSGALGRSWTTVPPNSVSDIRASLGLPDENTAQFLIVARLRSLGGFSVRQSLPGPTTPRGALQLPELRFHNTPNVGVDLDIIWGGGWSP